MNLTQEQRDQMLKKFDAYLDSRSNDNPLRERNLRVVKDHCVNNVETKKYRESMKRRFGIDPVTDTEKFPVLKESFSWGKFREQLDTKLKEADSESAFPLFLIGGLLQNIINMYELTKVSYQDWVTVTPTKLKETPLAALQGLSFPREVGAESPYPVVAAAALGLKIVARKYGSMYEVEQELLEDDQTGQFKQQSGMLGEYLQLLTEVLVYGKLQSAAGTTYAGFDVPVSETKPSYESNWPWSTAFKGGGSNRPSSYGALSQANIQAGIEALMAQKNLLGINMMVNPSRVLISPAYRFDLAIILNSAYYPSGAATAGSVGGAFAINPLQGIADSSVSRFMPDNNGAVGNNSKAWFLVDSSKPWAQVVLRTPVSVQQENPQAGESFDRDILRFKCNTRMNFDIIDARFAWKGSDGSV